MLFNLFKNIHCIRVIPRIILRRNLILIPIIWFAEFAKNKRDREALTDDSNKSNGQTMKQVTFSSRFFILIQSLRKLFACWLMRLPDYYKLLEIVNEFLWEDQEFGIKEDSPSIWLKVVKELHSKIKRFNKKILRNCSIN